MNKITIVIICVVIVTCISYVVFRNTKSVITNYPPQQGPIVAFGDSLVYGYGATKGNDFVSVVSRDIGYDIVNLGVSGDTTASALARVDTVLSLKPSIVMVLLGGNDFLRRVPTGETFSNLEQIIEKLQQRGAVVIVLGIQGGVITDPFAKEFEALTKRRSTAYVPNVLRGIISEKSLMFDLIHPNDEGYKRLADKVIPELRKLLQ